MKYIISIAFSTLLLSACTYQDTPNMTTGTNPPTSEMHTPGTQTGTIPGLISSPQSSTGMR